MDDAVQGPYVPVVGELSLLTLAAPLQLSLCGFVSYLALLSPTLGKGGEESLCGETESKMESAWDPKPCSISCHPPETAAEARTGLERKGSS